VAAIDRPWQDTPFALQGFHVRKALDIELVCRYCSYVQVDPRRRILVRAEPPREASRAGRDSTLELLPRDFDAARRELDSADAAIRKVFDQLKRGGRLEVKALKSAVDPVIKGVLRDSEAMAALVRIRNRGEYLYNHSLCNMVWSAVLGRHLGMQPDALGKLALGASILDVGMTRLDLDPLQKPAALSVDEMAAMRGHVGLGLELLRASGDVDPDVLAIVAGHHERFDGSGYPHGLRGHAIPLEARLAGLVDSYDAMITPRPHAPSRTSFEAMQELWDSQELLFQRELIEQFVQAIGLFPTGALVELNTGEVGIVVEQNESRRLRPKVVVVLDEHKQRYQRLVVVDLNQPAAMTDTAADLWIRAELGQGAYGVHPDEFFL
jgi:HD-GYP domain-containing protein (c-di-GMP phosphodiesterase class II)